MSVRRFFDTNVLVYADDKAYPAKQRRAQELITEHRRKKTGVLSTQVLQEYFSAAIGKLHIDASIARRQIEMYSEFDVVIPDVSDLLAAIDLHRLYQVSFWDALIFRAAKQGGCKLLLTEDFQPDKEVDGVRVLNPFT